MANFNDYLQQARNNLAFLEKTNHKIDNHYDWQVTVCFYTALHLINAHLSHQGFVYRSHTEVNHALNPENVLSVGKVSQDVFVSYITLFNLSRRSRYLVHENQNHNQGLTFLTYDKHFAKAIRHLDTIMKFFADKYQITFNQTSIKCPTLHSSENLNFFIKIN